MQAQAPALISREFFYLSAYAIDTKDAAKEKELVEESSKQTLYCSFCGKSQHDVKKLIAGPTVFICNECVPLCMDILLESTDNAGTPYTLEDMLRELFVLKDSRAERHAHAKKVQDEVLDPPTRMTAEINPSTTPP